VNTSIEKQQLLEIKEAFLETRAVMAKASMEIGVAAGRQQVKTE